MPGGIVRYPGFMQRPAEMTLTESLINPFIIVFVADISALVKLSTLQGFGRKTGGCPIE
jgi:hypothetical protein